MLPRPRFSNSEHNGVQGSTRRHIASQRQSADYHIAIELFCIQEMLTKASPKDMLYTLLCASSSSIFCLSYLKHDMPRLVNAIESVEHHVLSHFDPLAVVTA